MRIETGTPAQTEAAGAVVADRLAAGDVVLVGGELGSGKTTFVRGACRALGVRDAVTSPTFTIGQLYRGPVEVAHLDFYRLGSMAGEDVALLDDYLTADRIAFIEWPEAVVPFLERVTAQVRLEHLGGDRRSIELPDGGLGPGGAGSASPAPGSRAADAGRGGGR